MVAKAEKTGGGGRDAVASAAAGPRRTRSFNNKPSWLLCSIADFDDRMKLMLTRKTPKENSAAAGDSFAARANSYYHERPQLLALLQDLYNGYLSLADRYCQALAKNQQKHQHSRGSSPAPSLKLDGTSLIDEGDTGEVIDSDAESSLSFQPPSVSVVQAKENDADLMIADLVIKTVEYEIVLSELALAEKRSGETMRKMDLQKNLLDVLDSERLILLNDNAMLGYRVAALVEENKGLASESLFLKRKAAELARCVLKSREDNRVCMLSRKIEDLQGQIYGLEKRNKDYYERIMKQEKKSEVKTTKNKEGEQVTLEDFFEAHVGGIGVAGFMNCFPVNVKKVGDQNQNPGVEGEGGGGRVSKLWDKVKKFDSFLCGPRFNSATC
ncbi:kinase-interacting family protein-like [Primulina tabacum]|uniref:kinase-interacting family protein-like n=1 Tax=Primulina tabacum TaxID=48773 RepID=UPI003F5A09A4